MICWYYTSFKFNRSFSWSEYNFFSVCGILFITRRFYKHILKILQGVVEMGGAKRVGSLNKEHSNALHFFQNNMILWKQCIIRQFSM